MFNKPLWPSRRVRTALLASLFFASVALGQAQTIRVDASHPSNIIDPAVALGAGIDRLPYGAADKLYVQPTVDQVLSAGWQMVSYRQNTELHMEAWHWNPTGTWSDPSGKGSGYFTGSTELGAPIRHSYGYPLPHRGVTRDDGTDSDGYSRLDDGELNTYWKSNPYLTQKYTGEDDAFHPQWVFLDFQTNQDVDAIRIAWAEPYATKYVVQYWTGEDPIKKPTIGVWQSFPKGVVTNGKGGTAILKLADMPISVRWLRVLMTHSSGTCDTHGSFDPRNCLGYAIRELYVGTQTADGKFHDLMRHIPEQDQTPTYCSSVDPWHDASDLDEHAGDQVGFDLFYTGGYTRGLPAMIPIAMIYATPEDSAAEIAYIEKRGYPIAYVEMGEEPDGHYTPPEDYAALYIQWAAALHKVDPKLKLGGPIFTGQNKDIEVWGDQQGKTSWTGRFVDYLKAHGKLDELAFFSFEHYPFEPCKVQWSSLYDEATLVTHIAQIWRQDGVPENVPLFITESNLSWNSSEAFVDTFGALWLADYVGAFLSNGGAGVSYFHYLPLGVGRGCNGSLGTFGMFSADRDLKIQQDLSQFFASQLINLEWIQPGNKPHKLFLSRSDVEDTAGHNLVTSYAALRPDGQWALMIVNKDQENSHAVKIQFDDGPATAKYFSGSVSAITFGSEQYQWHPGGEFGGKADPDGPVARSTIAATGAETEYTLPQASITVLRGNISIEKK
ncbi:MAG: discoidin domain-containing protein [Candidatus Acidiferrales bacterium]